MVHCICLSLFDTISTTWTHVDPEVPVDQYSTMLSLNRVHYHNREEDPG